ncbi:MAG: hypothetical protein H0V65_05075 [Chitinophagales bacterium]|nr:hypothetical protein [Chitinophagales bacterium]
MQQHIRSGMYSDQYEKFSFSAEQFERMKVEEHEFMYQGRLYDIVKTESCGAIITITCINDDNEKLLIVELSNYLLQIPRSESAPNDGNTTTLLKFLQTAFIVPAKHPLIFPLINSDPFYYTLYHYQSPSSYLLYSPPESVLS